MAGGVARAVDRIGRRVAADAGRRGDHQVGPRPRRDCARAAADLAFVLLRRAARVLAAERFVAGPQRLARLEVACSSAPSSRRSHRARLAKLGLVLLRALGQRVDELSGPGRAGLVALCCRCCEPALRLPPALACALIEQARARAHGAPGGAAQIDAVASGLQCAGCRSDAAGGRAASRVCCAGGAQLDAPGSGAVVEDELVVAAGAAAAR